MNRLFETNSLIFSLWLLYWISGLTICFAATGFSITRLKISREKHLWSLIFLQLVLALNLFINFVAELNWYKPVLSDVSRVGGMITTSLIITAIAGLTHSQKVTTLNKTVGRFFQISGLVMAIHYLLSYIFFMTIKYDGSIKYFGGYRYIPAYTVFILQGIALLYAAAAHFASNPKTQLEKRRIKLIKKIMLAVAVLFPLSFIVDLVRYFFPPLWQILEEERLFLVPLYFSIINIIFIRYSATCFIENEITTVFSLLSPRENDVADLLCKGKRYKEIADILYISLSTVQSHVKNIYRKAEVSSKEALILKKDYP